MTSSIIITKQIASMFLIIFLGYFLSKKKIINPNHSFELTNLLIYVTLPCNILLAFSESLTQEKTYNLLISFILAILIHLLFILIAHFTLKDPIAINVAILSNSGYMGIPLVTALYGTNAVFYLSAFMIVNSLVQWTYGSYIMDKRSISTIKSIFKQPMIISIFIALILFFCQIALPDILYQSISSIAQMNSPLAMILLGVFLSKTSAQLTNIKKMIIPILYKLVMLPVLFIFLMKFLHISSNLTLTINLILAASPTAISVALFSEKLNLDSAEASQYVCLTTFLCIITLPLIIRLSEFIW